MALWGNKDTKSVTGTLDFVQNSAAVVGTGTAFTTELAVGQRIITSDGEYQVAVITDATNLTMTAEFNAASSAGETVTANEKPAYLNAADAGTTYGVDVAEAAETPELTQSGWVLQTVGSGGRAGRVSYETLVAMKTISGDAEDVVFADATITITTQPANASETTGDPASFTIVATATQGATIVYDWEVSTDAGGTWANATGGVYSGEATATLAISDVTGLDTYQYRCNLTATGATAVTSTAATLTEVGV
jgi:hypothetical protein